MNGITAGKEFILTFGTVIILMTGTAIQDPSIHGTGSVEIKQKKELSIKTAIYGLWSILAMGKFITGFIGLKEELSGKKYIQRHLSTGNTKIAGFATRIEVMGYLLYILCGINFFNTPNSN